MAKNPPAFQYYPADLIADTEVMFWDMECVGCYWQMITYLWLNGGKFEFNVENLRVLFRVKRKLKAEKLWEKIKKKFILEDGYITHKRVVAEMQKQSESRVKRQNAGKKGAEKRWKTNGNANSNAISKDMAKNSPSSSTSSSTSNNNIKDDIVITINPTLKEVVDMGIILEIPPEQAEAFYVHYKPQGWLWGNGQPITDLRTGLIRWRNNQYKFEKPTSDTRICIVDRKEGYKYQKNQDGEEVWLCKECFAALPPGQMWGYKKLATIERLVLEGKAKKGG